MRVSRQIELLDRLVGADTELPWGFGPESMRNPAAAYTDAGRFAKELEILFRGRPQFVGLTGECAQPGAYITAPSCQGTNSLSPRPSASDRVLSPEATRRIASKIAAPFSATGTPAAAP